jgi:transposase-like protein
MRCAAPRFDRLLAFMGFPKDHRPKIHSLNPLERLNGEIKRRTDCRWHLPQ